jgi:cytochrome c-type biogenesis protein
VPLALALVAGALASVNPCGFPLLPAFLSFYVGAEEEDLPRAPARVGQGLLVGLLVSTGFLAVFALVGVPSPME